MHYHVLTASWTVLHALLAMALLVKIILHTLEYSCHQRFTLQVCVNVHQSRYIVVSHDAVS